MTHPNSVNRPCELCGSDEVLIWLHGIPPKNTDLSQYKLGGCMPARDMFKFYCNYCKESYGKYNFNANDYISELEKRGYCNEQQSESPPEHRLIKEYK